MPRSEVRWLVHAWLDWAALSFLIAYGLHLVAPGSEPLGLLWGFLVLVFIRAGVDAWLEKRRAR